MFFKKKETKEFRRWQFVLLVLVVGASLFFRWYYNRPGTEIVKIGEREFSVLTARTEKQRVQGLSDRDDLGKFSGMLFWFGGVRDYHTFVMRRMRFPLDIIWIDGRVIVDYAPNVQPDPASREEDFDPYRPRLPATLVLEMPAGFIAKYGLKIGDTVLVGSK